MSLEEQRGAAIAGLEAARWQPSGTIRHGGSHALAFRGPAIELLPSARLFNSREAQSPIRLAADQANATGRRPATHGGVGQATASQVRQPARRAFRQGLWRSGGEPRLRASKRRDENHVGPFATAGPTLSPFGAPQSSCSFNQVISIAAKLSHSFVLRRITPTRLGVGWRSAIHAQRLDDWPRGEATDQPRTAVGRFSSCRRRAASSSVASVLLKQKRTCWRPRAGSL